MMSWMSKLLSSFILVLMASVPVHAQYLSQSEFETRLERVGQHPRDHNMEVVRACRIYGEPTEASIKEATENNLPAPNHMSSPYVPCPDSVLRTHQNQVTVEKRNRPQYSWKPQVAYNWTPMVQFLANRIPAAAVQRGVTVNIDGELYPLPNDRASLQAYDMCQRVVVPNTPEGTRYTARKPGCPDE